MVKSLSGNGNKEIDQAEGKIFIPMEVFRKVFGKMI
jgi:hypothetical protein